MLEASEAAIHAHTTTAAAERPAARAINTCRLLLIGTEVEPGFPPDMPCYFRRT